MKNKKLSLRDLKVNSFITTYEKYETRTLQGGAVVGQPINIKSVLVCPSEYCPTYTCDVITNENAGCQGTIAPA